MGRYRLAPLAAAACSIPLALLLASAARAQDPATPPAPTPARARRAGVEVYFSPNGGAQAAIVREIDGARTSIDVAMYSITVPSPISDALGRAAARGVRVRMVLNGAHRGARNKAKSLALERLGVDVLSVTRTMHEKFAVIDGATLLNGSGNWSASSDARYSENTVVFRSRDALVAAFQEEFDLLLSRARDFRPEDVLGRRP